MKLIWWTAMGAMMAAQTATAESTHWAFVGTYTGKESKGIYRLAYDAATGKLADLSLAAETPSPSFLAIAPNQQHLYAVNELAEFLGKPGGGVSAFSLDARTGSLTLINQQPSGGAATCHVVVERTGRNVLVANYTGGNVAVLPIVAGGGLAPIRTLVQHQGKSVDPRRQQGPHAHSINVDAANRFAMAADLGLDKVLIYRLDPDQGTLTAHDPPHVAVAPGAGPRHFSFHPTLPTAYAINEMNSTIAVMSYDAASGRLAVVQTVPTVPGGFRGNTSTAEVVVHPSGRFVYGSNRGHDSIAVFAVGDRGLLTPMGHQGVGVEVPRNFVVDPSGRFLLVANQGGGDVVVFAIDESTGALAPTGHTAAVPTPVCIRFVERR